ncbi:hypothetical protein DH2020_023469 [Rehmannia glutinosa]|uniref:Homeobox domain-containing protein n=1 Tax=Rehmannia glutinosa TaxID=99300 RepID=A0ABR0W656_REHGL
MELGLSLGDASKTFKFLKNSSKKQKQQQKTSGLGFCMALGLNTTYSVGNEEREKAHKKSQENEEEEDDDDDYNQISEGEDSDNNNREQTPVQLNLLPFAPVQILPWSSDNGSSENDSSGIGNMGRPAAKGLDVNRLPAAEEVSSANSVGSTLQMDFGLYTSIDNGNLLCGSKRDFEATGNDVVEAERASSKASDDDDENGLNTRKKLRLSKQQSAFLEESFKEHNTLNPKQKLALAKQLNLRPRQVEVWFQNRRARTKLKQTEVDCEYLKRCCETLTEENRRLHKELQDLRALKISNPYYMQLPATTLTMKINARKINRKFSRFAESRENSFARFRLPIRKNSPTARNFEQPPGIFGDRLDTKLNSRFARLWSFTVVARPTIFKG